MNDCPRCKLHPKLTHRESTHAEDMLYGIHRQLFSMQLGEDTHEFSSLNRDVYEAWNEACRRAQKLAAEVHA